MFYAGTFRSYGNNVCNRWYFTFDGAECTKPATMEGIILVQSSQDPYRPRHIEGYCEQVPKGHIRVGFWISSCKGERLRDGYIDWKSISRIQ